MRVRLLKSVVRISPSEVSVPAGIFCLPRIHATTTRGRSPPGVESAVQGPRFVKVPFGKLRAIAPS
jgi:hypothetical protein